MAFAIFPIVKAMFGVDLSDCEDSFTMTNGFRFSGVTYRGVKYRIVTLTDDKLEFYQGHPSEQVHPNIRYTVGIIEESYPLGSATAPTSTKKPAVEFTGVHTRFPDSEPEPEPEPEKKKVAPPPLKKKEWYTFSVYTGRSLVKEITPYITEKFSRSVNEKLKTETVYDGVLKKLCVRPLNESDRLEFENLFPVKSRFPIMGDVCVTGFKYARTK